ncbi:hypothetical protein ACGFYP_15820 [Streptomyces sp. NPDC048370]|uniref:hypothetical protein n=1 Tax=Streptomyces sp. NPDC048370 TaxID=3365540 RepID=UPI0037201217
MPTSLERLQAVQEAVTQLKGEFGALGVTLPSLGVDPLTMAGTGEGYPLVELGRCNLDTALRLAAVLNGVRR